jgi:hypothetical protein
LPLELRLKIWEWALPGARIVEVFIKGHLDKKSQAETKVEPGDGGKHYGKEGAAEGIQNLWLIEDAVGTSGEGINPGAVLADADFDDYDCEGDASDSASVLTIGKINPKCLVYVSTSPAPTLLHVCRESQEVALKKYQPRFGTYHAMARIYFNNELDTLYFTYWSFDYGTSQFANLVVAHEELGVQRVAFEFDRWLSEGKTDYINYQIAPRKWPGLREITLLAGHPHPEDLCGCRREPERPNVLGTVDFVSLMTTSERHLKWNNMLLSDTREVLAQMETKYPGWEGQDVRILGFTRNGVRV